MRYSVQAVISDYQEGLSARNVADKHGISPRTVHRALKKEGVQLRYGLGNQNSKKKIYNERFFSTSSPETAYHAGFGLADGCLQVTGENTAEYALNISSKDICILENFCDSIELSRQYIKTYAKGNSRIRITGKELQGSLRKWGIVPRKTHNFAEPDVPLELLPHFLRGWFDGDGCMFVPTDDKYSESNYCFKIVTYSSDAINYYEKALREIGFNGFISNYTDGRGYPTLCIRTKNNLLSLAELLKVREGYHLKRKWERVLSWS